LTLRHFGLRVTEKGPQGDKKERPQGDKKEGPFADAQGDVVGVILSEAKDLKGSASDRRISGGPSTSLRAT